MKSRKVLWPFMLLFFVFFSCNKEECCDNSNLPVNVDINFKLTFDGQPLVFNQTFHYSDSVFLKFRTLDFFISNFKIGQNDTISNGDEVFLLDFSNKNFTLQEATDGITIQLKKLSTEHLLSLSFGMGLNQDVNSKTPSDFKSTSPLSNTSFYWAGWDSYIFSRLEGKMDSLNDGNFEQPFTYHIGRDVNYKEVEILKQIHLKRGEENVIHVDLDIKKLFLDENQRELDIKKFYAVHGGIEGNVINTIINNYKYAFSIP